MFAGYNLIVTSETNLSAQQIYRIYHGLWRIEESFRIAKTSLQSRPVYLQTKESIYGHFLICYLSLLLLRLLELYTFNNELNVYDIINFIREYNVIKLPNMKYQSIISNTDVMKAIKKAIGLSCLDNNYLTEKNIKNMLDYEY